MIVSLFFTCPQAKTITFKDQTGTHGGVSFKEEGVSSTDLGIVYMFTVSWLQPTGELRSRFCRLPVLGDVCRSVCSAPSNRHARCSGLPVIYYFTLF